jgi:hypothetical protein
MLSAGRYSAAAAAADSGVQQGLSMQRSCHSSATNADTTCKNLWTLLTTAHWLPLVEKLSASLRINGSVQAELLPSHCCLFGINC